MPVKTNTIIKGYEYYRISATVGKNKSGMPIRKQFMGKSMKEAEKKRDDYLKNINSGLTVGFDKLMFGTAYDTWFKTVQSPSLSLGSVKRYEYGNRRIDNSELPTMKLADIKAIHIQSFYNDMRDNNESIHTLETVHILLAMFFKYCLESDLITGKSPMLAVKMPKDDSIQREMSLLSKDDLQSLKAYAYEDISAFIFVFLAYSGLREGECLALTHKDIRGDIIHVNKTVKYLTIDKVYQPHLTTPKTKKSKREVPLLADIKTLLESHMRAEKEKHLRLGIRFNADRPLFTSETCSYIEQNNLRVRFQRLLKRLDLPIVTVHSLRHLFGSMLSEKGVPLPTVSDLMGHALIETTARIYTHINQDAKKRAIATLSG